MSNTVKVIHIRPIPVGTEVRSVLERGVMVPRHQSVMSEVREFSEGIHGPKYQEIAKEYATTHAKNVKEVLGLEDFEKELKLARATSVQSAENEVTPDVEALEGDPSTGLPADEKKSKKSK